jgi:hypothetical protein
MALQRLLWAVFATALFLSPARAAMDAGDLICESSTTTGTGTLNLAGALTNYVTFASQITSGSVVPYHIIASDGKLEAGYGVYTDAGTDTLTRVASWSTDGSGAELTLPAGTHSVCVGPTAALFFNGAGLSTPHTDMSFQLDSDGTPLTALTLGFVAGEHRFAFGSHDYPTLSLYNTSASTGGPQLYFVHDSATPAASDDIMYIVAKGEDSAGNATDYAYINANIIDPTNGSEDGSLRFNVISAGADLTALTLGTTFNSLPTHILQSPAAQNPIVLHQTDNAGTIGPYYALYANSATPAASDFLGGLLMYGEDSAGNLQLYSYMEAQILDTTSTSEDSNLALHVTSAGADLTALTLNGGSSVFNYSSSVANPFIEVIANDGGTFGPTIYLEHLSATPAADDVIADIIYYGKDSGGNNTSYVQLFGDIVDPTNASEDSRFRVQILSGGASFTRLAIGLGDLGTGGLAIGPGGALNVDDNVGVFFYESEANGDNFKGLISAAANTADTTCTFENDANFIPDSCVGDGSDASDARLKDVIGPAGDVGGMIDGIKIYDFKWNTDAPEASEDIRRGKHGFGPLAQELFNINPDWVEVGGDDPIKDPWTWKPEKVVPYLIVEVQNLRKKLANSACYGIKLGNACIGVSM